MFNFIDKQSRLKDLKQALRLSLRFNRYILRCWKIELIILVLGVVSMGLSLLNPYLGKLILDKGIIAKDLNSLIIFSLFAGAVFVISLIFGLIFDYLRNYTVIKVQADLNRDVLRRLKSQDLSQLQARSSATYLFRLTNDIATVSSIVNVTLINFITNILKVISVSVIIVFLNPWLLLFIFVYQLFTILRLNLLIKPMERLNRLSLEQAEGIYQRLNRFFSHIFLFKVFGTFGREIVKYIHSLFDYMRLNMQAARWRGISNFSSGLSDKLFFGLVAFFGAIFVIKGKISLGALAAIVMYISQGSESYNSLTNMVQELIVNKISLIRVADLFIPGVESEEGSRQGLKPSDVRNIEFKNITFGYNPDHKILKQMSFIIEPAARIALVGYSGCGKTTLISLLLGLYQPEDGLIKVGEVNLQDVDSNYFLTRVGVALQEPFLLDDTIINNITYAAEKASREEVIQAADLVDLREFVGGLAQGFETTVGENAYRISQGQKQRIAIARAIIRNPQILIFDEATSSLDPRSEAKIITSIKEKFNKSTLIVISHRLSVIEHMDLIYFFQSPNVMRVGSHKDLLDSVVEYKEFFGKQQELGANISNS